MGVALLSAAARLWLLVTRPLWHDEVFTVWVSRLALPDLIRSLRLDSGPPLFYLLEKPVVRAAEALALPDAAARLISFVSISLLFAAARTLPAGARLRFIGLAATSPLLLLYSSEARAYALLALAGFVLFRLIARDSPRPGALATTALTAAALPWTHYLGLFVGGSLLIAALAARRRRACAATAVGLASFAPWVPILLSQPGDAMSWIRDHVGESAAGFLAALGGGARVLPPFGRPLSGTPFWLACAAGTGLLALLLLRPGDAETRIGILAVLLTLGGLLLLSFWRPIAVAGRSELAVLPIWMWLAARAGEDSLWTRRAVAAVIAIGLVTSALLVASPRASRPFAEVPDRLRNSARSGDLIVATANFYLPARLEKDRGRLAGQLEAFPVGLAEHPGWFVAVMPSSDDYRMFAEGLARAGAGRRVFLLLDPPYWTPRLREILLARGPVGGPEKLSYGLLIVSPGTSASWRLLPPASRSD